MENSNGYPYNFNLLKIEEMVKFFLEKNQPKKALTELDLIEDSYFKNRDEIDRNRPENEHLMGYSIAGLGIECDDPTKVVDFFHFKLREIIRKVTSGIDYGESEASNSNSYREGATIDKLALLLFFERRKSYNHDFDKIAREYGYKNGNKLKKTFSLFTDLIRRNGNCKELESQVQKLNRIDEYKWAIKHLSEDKKQSAIDEMKILESRLTVEE
ncbi:hypothetical protein J2X69_002688 [Algoriphagus sp. 4150]|uniref:hypothetical protein n=1 Tax=Algoriphagus sp. 4150 TaxID=2817756 RepID=UPI00285A2FC2|nr:hypothetical protein [Algoriphagus sp. 4150]MDR7130338.1 hypothetical protein [Algoriphagus sp. 4150]